jgi:hypothetical protein
LHSLHKPSIYLTALQYHVILSKVSCFITLWSLFSAEPQFLTFLRVG